MNQEAEFQIGDVLENVTGTSLAQQIKVTEVTPAYFKAKVVIGDNTKAPITVFRAGWFLYRKVEGK